MDEYGRTRKCTHNLSEGQVRFYYSNIRIFDLFCTIPYQLAWLVKQNSGQLLHLLDEIIKRIGIDTVLTVSPSTLEILLEKDL